MVRQVLAFLFDLGKATALYLAVVVGGITLLLIFAPVFGYLPYSDRPGPGWFGRFPAIGWNEFWRNALEMLGFGAFFAMLLALGGVVCVLLVRVVHIIPVPSLVNRALSGVLCGLITGYFMLGIGWYVALGWPALLLSAALGVLVGAWLLPERSSVGTGET